jgi:hypothetical protein
VKCKDEKELLDLRQQKTEPTEGFDYFVFSPIDKLSFGVWDVQTRGHDQLLGIHNSVFISGIIFMIDPAND